MRAVGVSAEEDDVRGDKVLVVYATLATGVWAWGREMGHNGDSEVGAGYLSLL